MSSQFAELYSEIVYLKAHNKTISKIHISKEFFKEMLDMQGRPVYENIKSGTIYGYPFVKEDLSVLFTVEYNGPVIP